jgi:hypothetical protein
MRNEDDKVTGNANVLGRQHTAREEGISAVDTVCMALRKNFDNWWVESRNVLETGGKSYNPSDRACQSEELPDAHKLVFSSPANSTRKLAVVNIRAVTLLSKIKQQIQLHNI